MTYDTIRFGVAGGVARIVFDRPEHGNAIDATMAGELLDAANRCTTESGLRCIVLSGAGEHFCVGGDISAFSQRGDDLPDLLTEVAGRLHQAVSRLVRNPAPVVAAVHGAAAGAGFSLACASDLVIAAESARFVMAYTGIGLSPDGSATFFLPRLVGLRRALELTLTNRRLSAAEALEWGLVTTVVADDELEEAVDALADRLAHGPTRALGRAARLLRQSYSGTLETQMEDELEALVASAGTTDSREGIDSFLDKRSPRFTGR